MNYFINILLIFSLIKCGISVNQSCEIINPNLAKCNTFSPIKNNYGNIWYYILQNVCTSDNIYCENPIPLEIIASVNSPCNNYISNPNKSLAMIQFSYGLNNNRIYNNEITYFDNYNSFENFNITTQNMYVYKINNNIYVKLFDNSNILKFIINDGDGITPQGFNGFVRSGPGIYDTAISCSYLNTKLYSDSFELIGRGYQEFIQTSGLFNKYFGLFNDKTKIDNGWSCWYFHIFDPLRTNGCACKNTNINGSKYERILYKDNNGRVWKNGTNALSVLPIQKWLSPFSKTNYTIGWIFRIKEKNMTIYTKPIDNNQELNNQQVHFWIGSVKCIAQLDNGTIYNGYGFNENLVAL